MTHSIHIKNAASAIECFSSKLAETFLASFNDQNGIAEFMIEQIKTDPLFSSLDLSSLKNYIEDQIKMDKETKAL